ncbi:MAG: dienelactone hydrolase family protein [Wenzhouxiangellaceae bacterium]
MAGEHSHITTEAIEYKADGLTLHGWLAWDASVEGARPGVLVVHEWWGLNEHSRQRAEALAKLGYTALAVDMYGDGKTADHPKKAGEFVAEVMRNADSARQRFEAALRVLRDHPSVNPQQTAAIGYCFGGGVVLNMARMGVDLDVVGSFHGSLNAVEQAEPGRIKARIAVYNGAADPFVPAEQVAAFKAEMDAAGADYQFIDYPATVHAFTNPQADDNGRKFDLPLAYNRLADESSWQHFQLVLQDAFSGTAE